MQRSAIPGALRYRNNEVWQAHGSGHCGDATVPRDSLAGSSRRMIGGARNALLAMLAKQPRQHCERMISKRLVAERLLVRREAYVAGLCIYGRLSHYDGFVNLRAGRTTPLPVDPRIWERMRAASFDSVGSITC
jgi:hypothetical protein